MLSMVMVFVILPEAEKGIEQWSGGAPTFHHDVFFTPEKIYAHMEALGREGRRAYVFFLLTADFFFPFLYSVLFSLLLFSMLRPLRFPYKYKFVLLPFLSGLIHLSINGSFVFLLKQYPIQYPLIVRGTALVSLLKWVLLLVVILLIGASLGYWGFRFFKTLKLNETKKHLGKKRGMD